jgi:excisionase family DNA binding protein
MRTANEESNQRQTGGDVLLGYKEAASLLNVCSRTLRRMVDARQLAVVRVRHGGLNGLRWGDLDLVSDAPTVTVRASISKNHKTGRLPLHPELVVELARLKPTGQKRGNGARCRT